MTLLVIYLKISGLKTSVERGDYYAVQKAGPVSRLGRLLSKEQRSCVSPRLLTG